MGAKQRARQREDGRRKLADESKATARARGVEPRENESRPWRTPLRHMLGRKRDELRRGGFA